MSDLAAQLAHLGRLDRDVEGFHAQVRADPTLGLELELCASTGVPPSLLRGRVQGPEDPLWLPEDRLELITYLRWRGGLCARCGQHPLDWVEERVRCQRVEHASCWSCEALNDARAEIPQDQAGHVRSWLVGIPSALADFHDPDPGDDE